MQESANLKYHLGVSGDDYSDMSAQAVIARDLTQVPLPSATADPISAVRPRGVRITTS